MPIFGKKNKKEEKEKKKGSEASGRKPPSPDSPQHHGGGRAGGHGARSNASHSPSTSMQNLASRSGGVGYRKDRELSGVTVKDKVSRYEQVTEKGRGVSASYTSLNSRDRSVTSPPPSSSTATSQHGSNASLLRPDVRSAAGSSYSSVASPASDQIAVNTAPTTTATTSPYRRPGTYSGFDSPPGPTAEEDTRSVKPYDGRDLPLPPLQMATVRRRSVVAEKSPANGGGFGFVLRQSYLPMPDDPGQTRLVHLVEPRPDYMGLLMTGDRITQVNGEDVEDRPHERVVELIKASGDRVELVVASMPELLELNARVFQGSDNPFMDRGNKMRKSARMKPGQTGTLRKQAAKAKKEFKVSCGCLLCGGALRCSLVAYAVHIPFLFTSIQPLLLLCP